MALFDCNNPCIVCPPGNAGDNPYLNLTSERLDEDAFIGRVYTAEKPPLGSTFFALGCVSFCLSAVSQEEANLCALRQNMLCISTNWPISGDPTTPGGSPTTSPRQIFGNTPQTCSYECPSGQTNTVTVPANTYFNFNQATANSFAYSLACLRARRQVLCLTALSRSVICVSQSSNLNIFAGGVVVAAVFAVSSGSLPPGMELVELAYNATRISGTPTATGTYNFTITCIDLDGNSGTGTYELSVLGITTASPLPEATFDEPYSQVMTADPSGVGIYTWAVAAGSLPPGLTMSPTTGTISGTPTTENLGYAFTVTVTDPNTATSCSKNFNLTVNEADQNCPIWADIVWDPPSIFTNGNGSASGAGAANTVHMETASGAWGGVVDNGQISVVGSLSYLGPGGTCCLEFTLSGTPVITFQNQMSATIQQNGFGILSLDDTTPPGVYSFTVAEALVPATIDIQFIMISQAVFASQASKNLVLDVTFGPCP